MFNIEWLCGKTSVNLQNPIVAGILNLTEDSFWSGSRVGANLELLLARAETMIDEGARILDIGAESTRPGAAIVEARQQIDLLVPAIKLIRARYPDPSEVLISADCYLCEVADACVEAGADIINDISGLQWDNNVLPVLRQSHCGYVLMHIQGTPQTMQINPVYQNVVREVREFFERQLEILEGEEIDINRAVLDPGIGFGKTVEHNLRLIKSAALLSVKGCPLYYGVSRKSFLGKLLGAEVEDRLSGTTAVHTLLLNSGVKILRVHDVKAAMDTVKLLLAIQSV